MPHVMHYLDIHLAESLDLTPLTERLIQGKDQATTLTKTEKLELWDRLKILSMYKILLLMYPVCLYLDHFINFCYPLVVMFYRFYKNGIIYLGVDYAVPLYQGPSQYLRETSIY